MNRYHTSQCLFLVFTERLTLNITGPDTEFLEEILHAVGERHGKLGVLPCYFPYLGQGILFALEETLGPEEWTDEYREAWEQVYELISTEMIKAILQTE